MDCARCPRRPERRAQFGICGRHPEHIAWVFSRTSRIWTTITSRASDASPARRIHNKFVCMGGATCQRGRNAGRAATRAGLCRAAGVGLEAAAAAATRLGSGQLWPLCAPSRKRGLLTSACVSACASARVSVGAWFGVHLPLTVNPLCSAQSACACPCDCSRFFRRHHHPSSALSHSSITTFLPTTRLV